MKFANAGRLDRKSRPVDPIISAMGDGTNMHAALVENLSAPPRYREIPPPVANQGEVLLKVRAAALSNLVRSQANGSHYSSGAPPFTPGNDGVGVAEDGARVYFFSPRAPFGSMAEYTVVSQAMTIPLAADIDDAVAAALGNPGLATWGSLLGRAKLQPGEAVMINGATGIAGKQAIQVAKYLGASKVIATGRNQEALAGLAALGADETISLSQPREDLLRSFRSALHASGVQVVLDFLWGPSAEAILAAAAGHGSPHGEPRIRFVQIGSIGGNTITLPAQQLRSSGVELLGSGLGSLSSQAILQSLTTMFAAESKVRFVIDIEPVPLSQVEETWTRKGDERRVVFMP
jgi:NADPH:quinone reductase-like Zn-dependent oxidoreductase